MVKPLLIIAETTVFFHYNIILFYFRGNDCLGKTIYECIVEAVFSHRLWFLEDCSCYVRRGDQRLDWQSWGATRGELDHSVERKN